MAEVYPTLWAHFESGELVNVEERIVELCCAPLEAVRYEPVDDARDTAIREAAKLELLDELEAWVVASEVRISPLARRTTDEVFATFRVKLAAPSGEGGGANGV